MGYYLADAYGNAGDRIVYDLKWPFRAAKELWRRFKARRKRDRQKIAVWNLHEPGCHNLHSSDSE